MAAIFTTPAQRPPQAVSDGHADDHTNGTYGVVLAAIITIMGKTLQGQPPRHKSGARLFLLTLVCLSSFNKGIEIVTKDTVFAPNIQRHKLT